MRYNITVKPVYFSRHLQGISISATFFGVHVESFGGKEVYSLVHQIGGKILGP